MDSYYAEVFQDYEIVNSLSNLQLEHIGYAFHYRS
jgi:hypothetical protein